MKVDYSKQINELTAKLKDVTNLQDVSNKLIDCLALNGVHIIESKTFVSSVTLYLVNHWMNYPELLSFNQNVEAVLQAMKSAQEYVDEVNASAETPLHIGYDFMSKSGVEFSHDEIREFLFAKDEKFANVSDFAIDMQIGTRENLYNPHIAKISIQVGGRKDNVGETGFGIKKYQNKVNKARIELENRHIKV